MNNKKILIIALVTVLFIVGATLLFLAKSPAYKDTYSSSEIYEQVKNSFSTEGGTRILDDDVILEFTDKNLDYLVDYIVVKANNAKNINEVGIFKVKNGKSAELKKIITKYLEDKQQSYRAMDYFPEEVEKIDCAKVVVLGNYIIYSFLNEKDTGAFYASVENLIKK